MISVIIPNYNHAPYLTDRLVSISNQTLNNFEGILLDDASSDNSLNVLQKYSFADNRFKLYINTLNSRSTFAQWNKGVSIAKGDYIWIAESDDFAENIFLQSLVLKLDSDPEIVLAYCQSYSADDKGEVNGTWLDYTGDLKSNEIFDYDFVMSGEEYIQRFLIHKNTIPNASAVLFRKSVFDKIGGSPVHLKTNGDWLTWLKMLCFGKVAYISSSLNYFRRHEKSVIAQSHKNFESNIFKESYDYTMRKEFLTFLKKNKVSIDTQVFQTNAYYMSLDLGNRGLFNLEKGNFLKGWSEIIKASFYPKFQSGFIKKAIGYQ